MDLTACDVWLRGAAAGLFLMVALVVLTGVRPLDTIKLLDATVALAGAIYAVLTAPFVPKAMLMWTLPVLTANSAVFWLWVRATFDDDFAMRRWHGALWLSILCIGFAVPLGWMTWATTLAGTGARLLSLVAIAFALLVAIETVRTWSVDLVAKRRRLRAAVLLATVFVVHLASADMMSISSASLGISGSFLSGLGLLIVAALAAWSLFCSRQERAVSRILGSNRRESRSRDLTTIIASSKDSPQ